MPWYRSRPVWLVVTAAVVMGLPAVRGGFVGSDDHRLVLNHVLVSRPSLGHAVELFTIPHRDLYQPLPLLSFSLEFAAVRALGLDAHGAEAVAWLFHLTNVLLHAINAVLVFFVVRRLHLLVCGYQQEQALGGAPSDEGLATPIATVAALLFAVHPIQTEVVAWINGRMMLLSTMFALMTVLAVARCVEAAHVSENDGEREAGRLPLAFPGAIAFAILCGLSKVRVGLAILAGIPIVLARKLKSGWAIALWSAVLVVTGVFAWINIRTTAEADLFSGGATSLHGPRFVRVCLALSHYFRHLAWPAGLCSYYPTPPVVYWVDAASVSAIVVTVLVLGVWVALAWRSWPARIGLVWFLGTLASTLPIIPARNVLAADRYLYLPIIGLVWPLAHGLVVLWRGRLATLASYKALVAALAAAVCVAYVGTSWYVGSFYTTPMAKTERIAMVSPNTPRVWTRAGWTHYDARDYDKAIEYARRDLKFDDPDVISGARELIGACRIARGDIPEGLAELRAAVALAPENVKATGRIAQTLEELGRTHDAMKWYERAVKQAPRYNPPKLKLARLYVDAGRDEEARALYRQVLEVNEYDVSALMGLSELDIAFGTQASLQSAVDRLRKLLKFMPNYTDARVNLAAALNALHQTNEAIALYRQVLRDEPGHATAALNLAMILEARGQAAEASQLLASAGQGHVQRVDQAIGMFDLQVRHGHFDDAVAVWTSLPEALRADPTAQAWLCWARAVAGQHADALALASRLEKRGKDVPLTLAARALVGLQTHHPEDATQAVTKLAGVGDAAEDARRRLLNAIQRYDMATKGDPWAVCLAARVLIADGQSDAGRAFTDLCSKQCQGPACEAWVGELMLALGRG